MTSVTLSADDTSPLLTYDPPGAWNEHNTTTDKDAENFLYQTYTQTQQQNSTISFSFEGFQFFIYGSKSVDHGNFTVDIDGVIWRESGRLAEGQSAQYKVPLFVAALHPGTHQLTVRTEDTNVFDLDYLMWVSSVNSNKTGVVDTSVVDDTGPSFTYEPGDSWSMESEGDITTYFGHTVHSTTTTGASASLNFSVSDAFTLWGTVGPNNGLFTVQLDGQPPLSYSANKPTFHTCALYYGSNAGPGPHTVRITNSGSGRLEIDYAQIFTLSDEIIATDSLALPASVPLPSFTSQLIPSGKSELSSKISPGAIAGIVVGGIVAISLVAVISILAYVICLKRKQRRERQAAYIGSPYTYLTPPLGEDPSNANTPSTRQSKRRLTVTSTSDLPSPREEEYSPLSPRYFHQHVPSSLSVQTAENGSGFHTLQNIQKVQPQSKRNHKSGPNTDTGSRDPPSSRAWDESRGSGTTYSNSSLADGDNVPPEAHGHFLPAPAYEAPATQ